ncbi:hypothetical protein [uncultured Desulfovibrio sp.]|uniref:hypothetical protein n=1 Tax=uncultured Desulfovibrio sp. TaxID=167968 RepID=UPI002623CAFE|nr:hypothetical protein [uncultured Desulfovibrio sp.]
MDMNILQELLGQHVLELLTGGALAACGLAAWVATLLPAPGSASGKGYVIVYAVVNFLAANLGRAQNADDAVKKAKKLQ